MCEGADAVAFAAAELHSAWSLASELACTQHPLPGKSRRVMMILSCLMCARPLACMAPTGLKVLGRSVVRRLTASVVCRTSHARLRAQLLHLHLQQAHYSRQVWPWRAC